MRTSSIVLTTGTLVSVAAASWLWFQVDAQRERNRELQANIESLQGKLARQTAPPVPEVSQPAAPAAVVTPAASPRMSQTMEAAPADAGPAEPRGALERHRNLLRNPEYRAALRQQQRLMVERRYRDLPQVLGLSAEKTQQVFDLLADRAVDAMGGYERKVITRADGTQTLEDERREVYEARVIELLGTGGMQQLQNFRESLTSRNEVSNLRNELAVGAHQLRDDQYEPLIAAVFVEQQRMTEEFRALDASGEMSGPASSKRRSQLAIAANARVVDAARAVLSDPQLAALKGMYRRQRLQMESQDEMNRIMSEAMKRDARVPTKQN